MKSQSINYKSGQTMMIVVIFFLFISLAIVLSLISPTIREFKVSKDLLSSKESYFLAESGIEDAIYRFNSGKQISSSESITVGQNTVMTNIVSFGSNEKEIVSLGNVLNHQRKISLTLKVGTGISFNYGLQAGNGGFVMKNNSGVYGNVYSNGNVFGSSGVFITGSVIASNYSSVDKIVIGSAGVGDAWANIITNSTITGNLYCQIGNNNNKICNTSQADPNPQPFPITDDIINNWKAVAEIGGTISGNYTPSGSSSSLGPKKITGNLNLPNGHKLTLNGIVWVEGNINISNNAEIHLASSFGSNGGILLADGYIDLSNNIEFFGSGTNGSYILVITTSDCPTSSYCNDYDAITMGNNSEIVVLNAQNGKINLKNNAGANSETADKIFLNSNATVTYQTGLANSNFITGPSGAWKIDTWEEIE